MTLLSYCKSASRLFQISVLFFGFLAASHSYAQNLPAIPKEIELQDPAGVDLTSHTLNINFPLVTFGDGTKLRHSFNLNQPNSIYFVQGSIYSVSAAQIATAIDPYSGGGVQTNFSADAGTDGAVLPTGIGHWHTFTGWRHVNSNGTSYKRGMGGRQIVEFRNEATNLPIAIFDENGNRTWNPSPGVGGFKWHDGEIWIYYYSQPAGCAFRHLRAITSNSGHAIQFRYVREACPTNSNEGLEFESPASIIGIPLSEKYCDFSAGSICVQDSEEQNRTTFTYSQAGGYVDVQSPGGVVRRLQFESRNGVWGPWISSVSYPGTNQQSNYNYGPMGDCTYKEGVVSATVAGQTWTYQSGSTSSDGDCLPSPSYRVDPLGGMVLAGSGDASERGTTYILDESNRWWKLFNGLGVTDFPEGNRILVQIDDRRNVKSVTAIPKVNGGTSVQIYSADYPIDCNNPLTCNKPNWSRDAQGNQTDFSYDPNHGGLLTQVAPPPVGGAARPLRLLTYSQRYAWTMGAAGVRVQGSSPIWVLDGEVSCQTLPGSGTPACDPAGPILNKSYEYGDPGSADALRVKAVVLTSPGSPTQRTCLAYDRYGRKVSETLLDTNQGACP